MNNKKVYAYYPTKLKIANQKMLENRLPESIKVFYDNNIRDIKKASIIICGRPSNEMIQQAENLELLIIPYAGLADQTKKIMKHYPQVKVVNIHHNATSSAEMAFTLMLTLAKDVIVADQKLREYDWTIRYERNKSMIVQNKKVLILGYGAIGKKIRAFCEAFQMNWQAICNHETSAPNLHTLEKLPGLIASADVVFISLPLTDKTRNLFDETVFSKMKSTAILINIARAEICVESALFNALKNRKIMAAGLDVWYQYPKSVEERKHSSFASYPFEDLPNVIISPHRAGGLANDEVEIDRIKQIVNVLRLFTREEPLTNIVDLTEGY